jgi:hypothetical protein
LNAIKTIHSPEPANKKIYPGENKKEENERKIKRTPAAIKYRLKKEGVLFSIPYMVY